MSTTRGGKSRLEVKMAKMIICENRRKETGAPEIRRNTTSRRHQSVHPVSSRSSKPTKSRKPVRQPRYRRWEFTLSAIQPSPEFSPGSRGPSEFDSTGFRLSNAGTGARGGKFHPAFDLVTAYLPPQLCFLSAEHLLPHRKSKSPTPSSNWMATR